MTVLTFWQCDGCDDKLDLARSKSAGDWKHVSVEVTGLAGYPTCEPDAGEKDYHLCPSCARVFQQNVNPRAWPRALEAGPHAQA